MVVIPCYIKNEAEMFQQAPLCHYLTWMPRRNDATGLPYPPLVEVDKELPAFNFAELYVCNNTSTPRHQRGTL